MEQKTDSHSPEYNPISCEHKLPNGFSSWAFYSGGSGTGPELNYDVSIFVCSQCGEIRVAGYRWDGKSKHNDRFSETFNLCHPDAIDAIIKQANFYNEEAKWGRVDPLQKELEVYKEKTDKYEQMLLGVRAFLAGAITGAKHKFTSLQTIDDQIEQTLRESAERECKG